MKIFIMVGIHLVLMRKVYTAQEHNCTTGINWFDASSRCGKSGLVFDRPTLLNTEQFKNDSFWIGIIQYKEVTPWMEPVGCYRYRKFLHTTYTLSSIGLCQHECSLSQHFGYQETTQACRCFNHDEFNAIKKVNLSDCLFSTSMNDSTIVYTRFNFTTSTSTNKEKKCMVSACEESVNMLFASRCDEENPSVKGVCDDFSSPDNEPIWGIRYQRAKNECLRLGKNLLSPRDCPTTPGISTWTSVFREEIVVEYNKAKPYNTPTVACLSGKRIVSEQLGIGITHRSCNETLQLFACRPDLHEETSSFHIVDKKCDLVVKKINTLSNTGALVGGILSSVITVVVVVLLMFWIRRKSNNKACKSEEAHSNTSQHELKPVKPVSNLHYVLEEDQTRSFPEYAVVEKKNELENKSTHEYAVVKKENQPETSEDTYAIASEEQYDKLNNVVSRKMVKKSNVYGIVGQSVEGEYDTTNAVSASNVKQTNDLYDTSIPKCSWNRD